MKAKQRFWKNFLSELPIDVFGNSLSPGIFRHGLDDHIAEVQVSDKWLMFDILSNLEKMAY